MTTPIIPWMGGKRRLADRLIPLFPPHECYVEVFAGGAALYFLRPVQVPVEVLNDINGDLVTLYRSCRTTSRSSFGSSNGRCPVGRYSSGRR